MRRVVPGRSRLSIGSTTNIVWDGNSLFVGTPGANGNGVPVKTEEIAPIVGSGASTTNVAVGGQTWRMMDGLDGGSSADVDAAYDSEASANILIAWETTNAVWAGRTGQQCYDDAAAYIANRLATNGGWRIVMLTALPRLGSVAQCGRLVDFNDLAKAGYRSIGVDVLVDVRGTGVFDFLGTDVSQFAASEAYWSGDHVHLTEAGAAYVAQLVALGIRRLR